MGQANWRNVYKMAIEHVIGVLVFALETPLASVSKQAKRRIHNPRLTNFSYAEHQICRSDPPMLPDFRLDTELLADCSEVQRVIVSQT